MFHVKHFRRKFAVKHFTSCGKAFSENHLASI
jgi:hypothetical protein